MSTRVRSVVLAAAALCLACPPIQEGEVASNTQGLGTTGTDATTTDTTTASTTAPETTGTTGEDVDPPIPAPLRAGVALAYLEGPVGVSMAGYGLRVVTNDTAWNDQLNGSRGFHGVPAIKVMALEAGDERLVLVKLPTMSSEASLTEGTADKLQALYGIDLRGRIITGATHSHHTQARYWRLPDALGLVGADSADEEVIDRMTTAFAAAIKAALDDLGPAQWAYGWADDWDPEDRVYRDRRGENDPTYGKDPRLTLLAVRRPGGQPLATIINFATHGTLFDSDNELLTEDAAGFEAIVEDAFYAKHGAPLLGMFIQSGGGDASPAGGHLGHRDPQKIEMIGHAAAPAILELLGGLEWRDEAALRVRSQRIDLTYERFGYDQNGEFMSKSGLPYTWGAWQCTGDGVDDANPETSLEGKPKQCTDVGALLGSLGESVPNGEVHQVYLSAALLDDLALVSLPGEPTYSVIHYLRESLGARGLDPLAFGYSQDHLLYLTHPDDWFQGGYETEMSLWGPYAAKTLVDAQMDVVDAMRAGPAPVFSEETPNLSLPEPFDPRAYEKSVNPGVIVVEPDAAAPRLETVYFAWGGGDPNLDTPHVVLERLVGGVFEPVPSASGRPGEPLDNRRYHMITSYEPDPPPNGALAESRAHQWRVAFELPIDLPAATYRLAARGRAWDGAAIDSYELYSAPFSTYFGEGALAEASLKEGVLTLRVEQPPLAPTTLPDTSWLSRGYRLHDPGVGPDGPLRLRAPLTVTFSADGVDDPTPYELLFDEGAGAYVFDYAATGLGTGEVSLLLHLRDDLEPSYLKTAVEVL
ncbi:MAG: neutral/alkaline non-lysosomal ceramidase N-terminal domain-containing protein [Nannocystaceae bacterium]